MFFKIVQDENPIDPREWGINYNVSQFVLFHKRYSLPCEIDIDPYEFDSYSEMGEALSKEYPVVIPVYAYEHGGMTIRAHSFSCSFDSGQIGFVVVSEATIKREYGDVSPKTIDDATAMAMAELKEYNQYLTGDVWGYYIMEKKTCDLGCEHEVELDSCFGFYGEENAIDEAERAFKYYKNINKLKEMATEN